MVAAPWVKRIDLQTGELTVLSLDPAEPLATGPTDHFEFDGQSWYHVRHREPLHEGERAQTRPGMPFVERRWAIHGTTASSDSALFSFMEFPEARHPQLESTLATDAGAVFVYADWLEEQGDPYAAALNPQLLKERGPAGQWFLEGLDRSGLIEFTLRDALVREVKLGGVPHEALVETMHRLCHLRACVALEHVSMERPANVTSRRSLGAQASDPLWRTCRWPKSLRRVTVSGQQAELETLEKALKVTVTKR